MSDKLILFHVPQVEKRNKKQTQNDNIRGPVSVIRGCLSALCLPERAGAVK